MRVIGELPNKFCKISLFQWNEKYLELKSLISDEFIEKVMQRFDDMHADWGEIALG